MSLAILRTPEYVLVRDHRSHPAHVRFALESTSLSYRVRGLVVTQSLIDVVGC